MAACLDRLELTHFRCADEAGLTFGPKTIILGHNGTGKSTIQDAIAYLATGACRGTTQDGKGIERVRRADRHGMSVSATFRGLGTFTRGLTARQITKGDNKGQWAETSFADRAADLLSQLRVTRRVFELAVRPDAFRSLHGRDQTAAILELAGVPDLSVDALLAAGCPPAIHDYAKHLDGSLEGYYAALKAAYDDRAKANRELTTARGALESAQAAAKPYDAKTHQRDDEQHRQATAELHELSARARQARAAHDSRHDTLQAQLDDLTERRNALALEAPSSEALSQAGRRADLVRERDAKRGEAGEQSADSVADAITALGLHSADTTAAIEARLEGARVVAKRNEAEAAQAREELRALGQPEDEPQSPAHADVRVLELLAEATDGAAADGEVACPVCESAVAVSGLRTRLSAWEDSHTAWDEAHRDWEERTARRAALQEQLARLEDGSAERTVRELESALDRSRTRDALQAQLAAAREADRLDAAILRLDADVSAREGEIGRQAEVAQLLSQEEVVRRQLEELGSFSDPTADAAAACEQRIAELEQALVGYLSAKTSHEAFTKASDAHNAALATHNRLDELVVALQGPIPAVLWEPRMRSLQGRLDSALRRLSAPGTPYGARLHVDDAGRLQVEFVQGALALPMECCSESERLRLAWALQCLAATETGLVILDAPEALDERFTHAPYELGDWLAEEGVQVLVCTTRLPDGEAPAGWALIELVRPAPEAIEPAALLQGVGA